jgi:hypothetical protein
MINYWTAFFHRPHISKYGQHYGIRGLKLGIEGDPFTKSQINDDPISSVEQLVNIEEPINIVLVGEPTDEELLALGNAVIQMPPEPNAKFDMFAPEWIDYHKTLVSRPQDVVSQRFGICRSRGVTEEKPWVDKEESVREFRLIRNGKEANGFFCKGCEKIIARASGACSPFMDKCSMELFKKHHRITLPPEKLFIPVKCCTRYKDFKHRSARRLMLPHEIDISNPQVEKRDSQPSLEAWTTNYFRKIVCPACAFYRADRISTHSRYYGTYWHGCSLDCSPRYCKGPHFFSLLGTPKDCTKLLTERRLLRLSGHDIDYPRFKAYIKTRGFEFPGCRLDPDLRIGMVSSHDDPEPTVHVYQARSCRYSHSEKFSSRDWVVPVRDIFLHGLMDRQEEFPTLKSIKVGPMTDLEYLAMLAARKNDYISRSPESWGHGWGNNYAGVLTNVYVRTRTNQDNSVCGMHVHYRRRDYLQTFELNDALEVFINYRQFLPLIRISSGGEIRDALSRRKVVAVKDFIRQLVESEERGTAKPLVDQLD